MSRCSAHCERRSAARFSDIRSFFSRLQVLVNGWQNRTVASTAMNRESSRSHAVFTVQVESKETKSGLQNIRQGALNLVDLAGSERQRDTHAAGQRLKVSAAADCASWSRHLAWSDADRSKRRHCSGDWHATLRAVCRRLEVLTRVCQLWVTSSWR